jgi:hypothetical protein
VDEKDPDQPAAEAVRTTIDEAEGQAFGNLFVELPELDSRHCAAEGQS